MSEDEKNRRTETIAVTKLEKTLIEEVRRRPYQKVTANVKEGGIIRIDISHGIKITE